MSGRSASRRGQLFAFAEELEPRKMLCGSLPPLDTGNPENLPTDFQAWSTSSKQVLYIIARFPDQAEAQAPVPATVQNTAAEVNARMQAYSYGRVALSPVVTATVVLPQPMAGTGAYAADQFEQILIDARAAAVAANPGWNYQNYDLHTVRYNGGPGQFQGAGAVRSRRSWLKVDDAGIYAHEFGHNLGLWHANALLPDDPTTTTGTGANVEYGNPFDVMGNTSTDAKTNYNVWEKHRLGWMSDAQVSAPTATDTLRIYPFDTVNALDGARKYAIRVRKDPDSVDVLSRREYWIGFRQHAGWAANRSVMNGLEVNWCARGTGSVGNESVRGASNGGSQLLDMAPETSTKTDAPLVIGRTFSDPMAGVQITPLQINADGSIDVKVQFFNGVNQPPTVSITGPADAASDALTSFVASASDPEGDPLTYHWDFEDKVNSHTFSEGDSNSDGRTDAYDNSVSKIWEEEGDYRVRLTVSDTRGGTATKSLIVRVDGFPSQRISGRVRSVTGEPLQDVRVSDGAKFAYTDSDGTYTLSRLAAAAPATLTASKPGWSFTGLGFGNPVTAGADTRGIDFDGMDVGYKIYGKVRQANPTDGPPVPGVVVTNGTASATTDAAGVYALPVRNGIHPISFSKPGFRFAQVKSYVIEYADQNTSGFFFGNVVDTFAEQGSINGRVFGLTPGSNLGTIEVSAGGLVGTVVMDFAYGAPYYSITSVPIGAYNVTASGSDGLGNAYRLVPEPNWTNALNVDGNLSTIDFRLEATTYRLYGRVAYSNGVALPGATVTAGGKTVTTADDGNYVIHGLSSGPLTVTAQKAGVLPLASRSTTINSADLAGINFSASTPSPQNAPPVVSQPASAAPAAVYYLGTWLSVLGDDDRGRDRLRYIWTTINAPAGATVAYPVLVNGNGLNGTSSAQRLLATFSHLGTYTLRAKIEDESGAAVTSDTTVTVVATTTKITLDPVLVTVIPSATRQFAALALDQFGQALAPQPLFTWTTLGTGGSVNGSGIFTAGGAPASLTVTAASGGVIGRALVNVKPYATMSGRHVFYNNSAYDGVTGDPSEGLAIAPDKTALLPGQTATSSHFTSYVRGLNGIMIDLNGLWGAPTAQDFIFAMGNDADPAAWATAPDPSSVSIWTVPSGGQTIYRVALIWPDFDPGNPNNPAAAVANKWLKITVKATQATGLSTPDVFYLGNLIGESYFSVAYGQWRVGTIDTNATKANYGAALIDNLYDFNRDTVVDLADADISKANLNMVLLVLSAPA